MSEIMNIVKNYSIADIVVILLLLYAGGKWLLQQISENKSKYEAKKKEYHKTESEKENKEKDLESRLNNIESHLKTDYERIQKAESHLYQIETIMKQLNSDISEMRIQSLRKQILDFTDKAINTTTPISREAYMEVQTVYNEYEDLIKEKGLTNGVVDYSYRCILHSFETREKNNLFLEDFYIAPAITLDKMRLKTSNKTSQHQPDLTTIKQDQQTLSDITNANIDQQ